MADTLTDIARRHGVSEAAVRALADAIRQGGGRQAQFSHPELGGMGQWNSGGMIMIGAMADHALKAKVAALAEALAGLPAVTEPTRDTASRDWWPAHLGTPASSGAQNGIRYAVFPHARRIVIERDGKVVVHDSGTREFTGVAQQQGHASTLAFSGPDGTVSADDLPIAS